MQRMTPQTEDPFGDQETGDANSQTIIATKLSILDQLYTFYKHRAGENTIEPVEAVKNANIFPASKTPQATDYLASEQK